MRKEHRPFFIKQLQNRWSAFYVRRWIRPQFDALGKSPTLVAPSSLKIFGTHICAGDYLHLISSPTKPVSLTTWRSKQGEGRISIGNYCLISPGAEITSAEHIRIGDSCMIAAEVVISDSDWHGLYNRTRPFRCTEPVTIANNVWLGQRSIICKGVTIGENSVIGAGAVVTRDIPANVVAAGNPARVVKQLNPNRRRLTREFLFQNGDYYGKNQNELDRYLLHDNRFLSWLRVLCKPGKRD